VVLEHPDAKQIELYLVGALPEAETERLDELSLTDDSFAERLRAAENDLVDAYARGELSADLVEAFNAHYLASPNRREKVHFALAFQTFGASGAAGVTGATFAEPARPVLGASSRPWWERLLGTRRPAWAFVLGLLLLIVGGYLVLENFRLRSQLGEASLERLTLERRESELEQLIENNKSEAARAVTELAQVRERLAQLERNVTAGQATNSEDRRNDLRPVAFTLAPPIRSAGSIPTLPIPKRNGGVVLTLEIEADAFPGYRGALSESGGSPVIWQSGSLKPFGSGQKKTVSVRLGPGLLRQGIYNLELAGLRKGERPENIGIYTFRVVIQ